MKQREAVVQVLEKHWWYADLSTLRDELVWNPEFVSDAKDPFANIRRIVQTTPEEIYIIRPWLYWLVRMKEQLNKLLLWINSIDFWSNQNKSLINKNLKWLQPSEYLRKLEYYEWQLSSLLESVWSWKLFWIALESKFLYESEVICWIDESSISNPEKEAFIRLSERIKELCFLCRIKFVPLEDEFKEKQDLTSDEKNYFRKIIKWYKINHSWDSSKKSDLRLLFDEIPTLPYCSANWMNDILKEFLFWDKRAITKLIKVSMRSIVSLIKYYWVYWYNVTFLDLVWYWALWVLDAALKYDPRIWWRFYDYSWWSIKSYCTKATYQNYPLFNVPLHKEQDRLLVEKTYDELTDKLWRIPTTNEVSKATWMPCSKIFVLRNLNKRVLSLDSDFNEDFDLIDNRYLLPNEVAERLMLLKNLDDAFWMLDEKAARIIQLRFWVWFANYPRTLEEVWNELQVTRERVRQIEQAWFDRFRSPTFVKILWIDEEEIEKDPTKIKRHHYARKVRDVKMDEIDVNNNEIDNEDDEKDDTFDFDFSLDSTEDENLIWLSDEKDNTQNSDPNNSHLDEVDVSLLRNRKINDEYWSDSDKFVIPLMCWIPYDIREKMEKYMESVTDESFSLKDFNLTFVHSIFEEYQEFFNDRINFKWYRESSWIIWKKYDRTSAWVFITEKMIYWWIESLYWALWDSRFWKQLIHKYISNNYLDDQYGVVDFINYEDDWFYWSFLWLAYEKIFSATYNTFKINTDSEADYVFCYFKKDIVNVDALDSYFNNIDTLIKSDREEDKYYSKDTLIAKVTQWKFWEYLSHPDYYFYFISKYLSIVYSVFFVRDWFTLPKNKDSVKYKVLKLFDTYDKPVHFSEIIDKLKEQYPWVVFNENRVKDVLSWSWKALWYWMYANNHCEMNWWNIWDLIESYLKESWCSQSETDVINYVKSHKFTTDHSIVSVFTQDWRFIRVPLWRIWLKERGSPEEIKSIEIENNILKVLSDNPDREFTRMELFEALEKWLCSVGEFNDCLVNLINNKKLWITQKDITQFFHVL